MPIEEVQYKMCPALSLSVGDVFVYQDIFYMVMSIDAEGIISSLSLNALADNHNPSSLDINPEHDYWKSIFFPLRFIVSIDIKIRKEG